MKIKLPSLVFLTCFFASGSASATLSFLQGDAGIVAVLSTGPCPVGSLPSASATPSVTVNSNNEIDVTSSQGGVRQPLGGAVCDPQSNPPIILKAPLGKLPDGIYTVVWNFFSPSVLNATGKFAVVSGTLSSIFPTAVTGFWYDPAFSGSGFNFQMSPYGLLVTYYGWDATGNRLWLTSDVGPQSLIPNVPVTLNMTYTTGGTFTVPQHNLSQWGSLTLTFSACNAATAKLSGKDGTVNLHIVALVGADGLPGC